MTQMEICEDGICQRRDDHTKMILVATSSFNRINSLFNAKAHLALNKRREEMVEDTLIMLNPK